MTRLRSTWAVVLLGLLTGGVVHGEPMQGHKAFDQAVEIRTRLEKDPNLKNQRIDVTVADGIAILTGTVDTRSEKMNAGDLAMVKGIVAVQNQLEVGGVGLR